MKALTFYQFPPGLYDFEDLQHHVERNFVREPGPLEIETVGFTSFADDSRVLRCYDTGAWVVRVQWRTKKIPPAVLKRELAKRVAEYEEETGSPAGSKIRKRLAGEVVEELLPKAFIQERNVDVIFYMDRGLLAVGTASQKQADEAVSCIRRAMATFPALPLSADLSAPAKMYTALVDKKVSDKLLPTGANVWFKSELETAKLTHVDLYNSAVVELLDQPYLVVRLSMSYHDFAHFVFTDTLQLRSIKLLDDGEDAYSARMEDNGEHVHYEFWSWLARELFDALRKPFGFSAGPEPQKRLPDAEDLA